MAEMRRDEKRKFVRDAIYAAAIEIFTERGFDETTVEEIAQAAGVSRRSFFRYFASKDAVIESRKQMDASDPIHKPVLGRAMLGVARTGMRLVMGVDGRMVASRLALPLLGSMRLSFENAERGMTGGRSREGRGSPEVPGGGRSEAGVSVLTRRCPIATGKACASPSAARACRAK